MVGSGFFLSFSIKRSRPTRVMTGPRVFIWSLLLVQWKTVLASVVGAAVLPHGDFAFDPGLLVGIGSPADVSKASSLHSGTIETIKFLESLRPDVILFTSPHGLESSWDWSFYGNSHLVGRALVGRDLQESFGGANNTHYTIRMQTAGAPELASELVDALSEEHQNVTLLKGWNDVLPQELHWGEVLPLGLWKGKLPPLLVVGLPISRYNFSSVVADGVLQLGQHLGRLLSLKHMPRVAILVSTDLAHRHWANTSFGFSPDAAPFDAAMGQWAAMLDQESLMGEKTLSVVDHIYSCGYLGMILLHGLLAGTGARYIPRLTSPPQAPTYYGMMSASFELKDNVSHVFV